MLNTKTSRSIALGATIIILAIIIAVLINKVGSWKSEKKYAAVHLITGDTYFGELHKFPRMSMTNVVYIEENQETGELTVKKLTDSVWAPKEPIYINDEQVEFWAFLQSDSDVVKAIEGTLPVAPAATQPTTPAPAKK
ncbi:MAG: hypothetical protein PHP03_00925 [Candidatus Pacebacteria bacterium]|nr:hypothetical protein [Candidatus Paceibacterota bacterium]